MKKQNEQKNEAMKQKRERTKHLYFLMSESNGFIETDPDGKPTFNKEHPLITFTDRRMAKYAAMFFKQIGFADDIIIWTTTK